MFKKRLDRVVHIKESDEKFKQTLEKEPLEKKDIPALIIAAFLVFIPVLILVIGLIVLASTLFFRAF